MALKNFKAAAYFLSTIPSGREIFTLDDVTRGMASPPSRAPSWRAFWHCECSFVNGVK